MDSVTDWTALQIEKVFEAVFPDRRCRQTKNLSGRTRLEQRFKCDRRHVMALIDDHQAIPLEKRRIIFNACETGKHRNIEFPSKPPCGSTPDADLVALRDSEKSGHLFAPLIEKERAVD